MKSVLLSNFMDDKVFKSQKRIFYKFYTCATYPLADVILKRTETPGKTTPPGINKSGNFFGILGPFSIEDIVVMIITA